MKRLLLPLIALAFLVGACSSQPKTAAHPPGVPPKVTGKRTTAWGELPTYDGAGHYFTHIKRPRMPGALDAPKSVTLDIVVNADGSVEDATVTASSGDLVLDRTALACLIGARYTLKLAPDNPAPFVVQTTWKFTREQFPVIDYDGGYGPVGRQDSRPPEGAPYYQAWYGGGGGWSGGGSYSNSSSSCSSSSSN
jgi:TonB family protein